MISCLTHFQSIVRFVRFSSNFVPELKIKASDFISIQYFCLFVKNTAILLYPIVWPDAEFSSDDLLELYPYRRVVELSGVTPKRKFQKEC